MKKTRKIMPEEKEILDPYALVGGVALKEKYLGATKESYEIKKKEAQSGAEEDMQNRADLLPRQERAIYKALAIKTLSDSSTEEDMKDFESKHDPGGNHTDILPSVIKDKKSDKEHNEKYQAEKKAINAEYAVIDDKNSPEAIKNRDQYNSNEKAYQEDQKAKAEEAKAEEAENTVLTSEINALNETLKVIDVEIAEYDKNIDIYTERSNKIESTIKVYSQKYKDHDLYLRGVDEIVGKDECTVPPAAEAHKEATAYYRGRRICTKINDAIRVGKYYCRFPFLYETEIAWLMKLGYDISLYKDKNKRDRKRDKDDKNNYTVSWSLRLGGGDVIDIA